MTSKFLTPRAYRPLTRGPFGFWRPAWLGLLTLYAWGCGTHPTSRSLPAAGAPPPNRSAHADSAAPNSHPTVLASAGAATISEGTSTHETPTPSPKCAAASTTLETQGTPCGALQCKAFARAEEAVNYVVRETLPAVLAVGEIHAQKDAGLKASPTRRFAELLPMFCGQAHDIVIELWTARNDCKDDRVARVREAQKPVTLAQAPTNQNDFLELGNVAKANGIQPHALVPSCEDYQSIINANERDIARMLELTATRSAEITEKLLERNRTRQQLPIVILYGGAMHNDLTPPQGRESFSYGPQLDESTGHHITELDIVLREQVKDTEIYRRFPWYPHFRNGPTERQFALYRLGPRSFTLIYPAETHLP